MHRSSIFSGRCAYCFLEYSDEIGVVVEAAHEGGIRYASAFREQFLRFGDPFTDYIFGNGGVAVHFEKFAELICRYVGVFGDGIQRQILGVVIIDIVDRQLYRAVTAGTCIGSWLGVCGVHFVDGEKYLHRRHSFSEAISVVVILAYLLEKGDQLRLFRGVQVDLIMCSRAEIVEAIAQVQLGIRGGVKERRVYMHDISCEF